MSKLRQYQADAKIADLRTACRLVNAAHDYLEKKVEAQAFRIAALEKALEPFARACDTATEKNAASPIAQPIFSAREFVKDTDFSTARALLNPTPTASTGEAE